ncbi:hypothetical protein [Stutzerimonas nitrititolerans]|uniref:hypothetical protein n=1 Tax=Stutzerimonas nitrititolerans TaxID=2482751 RepID=UPI0028AB98FD|nr:hypothetical protein [Stutzerimonas nitrititolerans]
MFFTPASFGFDLNNREISTLIYLGLVLACVLLWKEGRPLVTNLARAFFAPRLALIWLLMSLYVVACVWVLARLSLWEWFNLKSTLLWWLTVGFTSVFDAQRLDGKPNVLRKMLYDTFTLSAVIIFIAELVSFPLWVELLMLPALVFLTALIAVGEHQVGNPGMPLLLKLLRGLQIFAGLIILSASYWLVVTNVEKIWSLNILREFGLPFLLWLMFIPFVFLLSIYMVYEEVFVQMKIRPVQASIYQYARWRALFSFGWNVEEVRRLSRDMRECNVTDKRGVKEAIQEIKRLREIEKNPPTVAFTEGWSPYESRLFLEDYGLVTDDYHRTQWGWCAGISSVKLNDRVLADRISYYLSGSEYAVTQLRITLLGSMQNDANEAQFAFDKRALSILTKIFDAERASATYACVQTSVSGVVVIDGIVVSLERSIWGDNYDWNLIIRHPKHQDNI